MANLLSGSFKEKVALGSLVLALAITAPTLENSEKLKVVDPNALLLTSVKLEITSTFVTSRVTTLVSISAPLVAVIVKV